LPYRVNITEEAKEHLRGLPAQERTLVLDRVLEQLTHQPNVQTRNRKPLRPNPLASWELRIGRIRVYYDVIEVPEPYVEIRGIGIKERHQVYIAGKAVQL
jgi:mRNA-degrading endonuclease RelE of RelBE toxin-antitoxin system